MLQKLRKNWRTSKRQITDQLKEEALKLGFTDVRITKASTLPYYKKEYSNWIKNQMHGEMQYLENHEKLKTHPKKILPAAKSIIFVSLNYYQDRKNSNEGQIARYAHGRDYHKVFKSKLKSLDKFLKTLSPNTQTRFFSDSGPLLERQYAEQAGIGFVGKNTMVITLNSGSWILLGEIITDLDLEYDSPADENYGVCGTCTRCIDICPTKALDSPYKIDAKKCISYLTIENKGPIPIELRPLIGNWLFGCDLCQEVCPHNIRQKVTNEPNFTKKIAGHDLELKKILEIKSNEQFLKLFAGSPIMRAGRIGLIRNACVVAGNLKRKDLKPQLTALSKSDNAIIKEHASWALSQI